MKIEQLIQVLRKQGYILNLSSTQVGADSKYSAKFFHKNDAECEKCNSPTPNKWDDYQHAPRLKLAVLRAAQDLTDRCPAILVNIGATE